MHTRTAPDSLAEDRFNSSASRVEEQLAFIDNVCALLIESRFGDNFGYSRFGDVDAPARVGGQLPWEGWVPMGELMARPSAIDMDIDASFYARFNAPETVSPVIPDACAASAAARPRGRSDSVMSFRLLQLATCTVQARGSPSPRYRKNLPFVSFGFDFDL
jgi:hypothetical protein